MAGLASDCGPGGMEVEAVVLPGKQEPGTALLATVKLTVEDITGSGYQPQADPGTAYFAEQLVTVLCWPGPLPLPDTLTQLKPVKQNVTYDSETGKMYAELGSSTAGREYSTAPASQPAQSGGFQPYSGPAYQPYSLQPGPYSGYTPSYSSPGPQYDRSAGPAYTFAGPTAFLPHSAINLSVKTEEAGQTGQPSTEPSPQILDLTRPLRWTAVHQYSTSSLPPCN